MHVVIFWTGRERKQCRPGIGKSTRVAASTWLVTAIALISFVLKVQLSYAANISSVAGKAVEEAAIRSDTLVGEKMRFAYFLEQMPTNVSNLNLPPGAHGVMIARVRLRGAPTYLGVRDQSGEGPRNIDADLLLARVEVIEVESGQASSGDLINARFGRRGEGREFMYRYTPEQLSRDYFAVIYMDADDGVRRLAAFAVSEIQYSQWKAEQSAYSILRDKPGFRE